MRPGAGARLRGLLPFGRRGASEVLSQVLMVAVTIVLVGVLFMLVSGPAQPPRETATVVISVGEMTANATNASRNDTLFTVGVKLGNGDIRWNDTSFLIYILDASGTLQLRHNTTTADRNMNELFDAGDTIAIRNWPPSYHGLKLTVAFHNRIVGEVPFP